MAIGYRQISMSATSIGPIKAMILTLNVKEAARAVDAMLATAATTPRCAGRFRNSPGA